MKIDKNNFIWIFSSAILAILLAVSIYLGISGWYFKTDFSYTTDLILGKTISTTIKKNQAQGISFNIDGSYLSGQKLPQIVSIKNEEEIDEIYLRAKVYIYSGDNKTLNVNVEPTVNWNKNEIDGYYYFNNLLPSSEKVTFCSNIVLDENENYKTDTKYIVSIIFESLSKDESPLEFWQFNPINNLTTD